MSNKMMAGLWVMGVLIVSGMWLALRPAPPAARVFSATCVCNQGIAGIGTGGPAHKAMPACRGRGR